jgi:anti-sigma factor (TIGR02949 family)
MTVINFNERSCERYRRYFDAYLDNELLIETSQDVLQHLTSCPDCARSLEARAQVKQLVKDAVIREEAPPELVAALRSSIQREQRSFFSGDTARWTMAAAAVLLIAIGGFSTSRWAGTFPFSDQSVAQTLSGRVGEILRVGLINHVHCTILFKQWKRLLSFEEMKVKTGRSALGPEFIDLVPVVQAKLGKNYKINQAHRCSADGRRFVHFIVQGEGDILLSLVITEKQGESFTQADARAVMKAAGVPVYHGHQGQLEIAGFETEKYLGYVVSNLDRAENLRIAEALVPSVHDHLQKLSL